jgi:hypothetical protein
MHLAIHTSLGRGKSLSLAGPRLRRAGSRAHTIRGLAFHLFGLFAKFAKIILDSVVCHVTSIQASNLGDDDLVVC